MTDFEHLLTATRTRTPLLYHYTSRQGLRAILETGQLRLNTLDRMNDPRERREWLADGIFPPPGLTPASLRNHAKVVGQIHALLRLAARVACLTADRPRDRAGDPLAFFHKGWGRARMWEQYAQQHEGAVLVFERDALIMALDAGCKLGEGDVFSPSSMQYEDRRLSIPISGAYNTIEAINDVTSKGSSVRDLFFVKNRDWEGETEFRILFVYGEEAAFAHSGLPLGVSYQDSLRGVVLGERWHGARWLAPLAKHRGIETSIVKCDWENGAPVIRRYP